MGIEEKIGKKRKKFPSKKPPFYSVILLGTKMGILTPTKFWGFYESIKPRDFGGSFYAKCTGNSS